MTTIAEAIINLLLEHAQVAGTSTFYKRIPASPQMIRHNIRWMRENKIVRVRRTGGGRGNKSIYKLNKAKVEHG